MLRLLLALVAISGVSCAPIRAPRDEGPLDVVVTRDVELPAGARVRSIRFPTGLTAAATVHGGPIVLVDGARVVSAAAEDPHHQRIAADLELLGTATFVNENASEYEASSLRLLGRLVGAGTLVVGGAGNVSLRGDSSETFVGAVRIDGGNLLARSIGSLGAPATVVTLTGGRLHLAFREALPNPIHVEDDATVWGLGLSWLSGAVTVDEGATLTIDGEHAVGLLTGVVSGVGELRLRAGRDPATDKVPNFAVAGDVANALRGAIRVERGALALGKPDGVAAIAHELVVGGSMDRAEVRLEASDQIADTARVTLIGPGTVELQARGHREFAGPLELRTDAVLRCGDGADVIGFAASRDEEWSGTLIVEGWRFDRDRVSFGESADALTPEQLARIGFRDLDGQAPGLLRATIREDGTLSPGERVSPRPDLLLETDGPTDRKRRVLYEVDGIAALCGPGTRLREGDTVSFFGGTITWLGALKGFTHEIADEIAYGANTKDCAVRVRNRGIKDGGVRDLRDGSPRGAWQRGSFDADMDTPQAPFAEVLREDRTTVAVIVVGVEDVARETTDAEFEDALRALCRSATEAGARVVLATPMLDGERPDGTNPSDARIDELASITRRVAVTEKVTLVDLRAAAIAWLQNHNRKLRLDGTFDHARKGLLTGDGIQLSERGDDLVAELLADGIHRALAGR